MFVKTTRETKKTLIGHLQPKWTYAKVTRKETPEKTIAEQQGHILANQIASCFFELTSKLMTLHHINRAFARTCGFYARFYLRAFSRVVNKHDAKKLNKSFFQARLNDFKAEIMASAEVQILELKNTGNAKSN